MRFPDPSRLPAGYPVLFPDHGVLQPLIAISFPGFSHPDQGISQDSGNIDSTIKYEGYSVLDTILIDDDRE
jgi:hypothetical protein